MIFLASILSKNSEMEKRMQQQPVFQKLSKMNTSGILTREQYTGLVGFQIFTEVHHGWHKRGLAMIVNA